MLASRPLPGPTVCSTHTPVQDRWFRNTRVNPLSHASVHREGVTDLMGRLPAVSDVRFVVSLPAAVSTVSAMVNSRSEDDGPPGEWREAGARCRPL